MPELQVVVFSLNNEICGVDTFQVTQIIGYQDITKIPQMPKFIEGITNLRGIAVPIVNLNKRFDLGETVITEKTKIIVTEINRQQVGFIVNDVIELTRFAAEEIEAVPELIRRAGNHYMKNVGKKGEKLISILDLTSVLSDNEIEILKS